MGDFCKILSLTYARLSPEEAKERVLCAAREGKHLSVFTPGATVAAKAEKDGALRALLESGDLILADGVGCRLAARFAREGRLSVVRGIELGEALLDEAEREGLRVFFYGGRKGVAVRAAAAVRKKHPSLEIRCADGYGEDPLNDILAFSPHLLFVCLGSPRQELYIVRRKQALSCACLGLGGSFDVWSGDLARAPRFLRLMGLEWLWRTLLEPKRICRLLPLPAYFLKCADKGLTKLLHKRQKSR